MIGLLKKIFGTNDCDEIARAITVEKVEEVDFNKVDEQIEIYSDIDGIPKERLMLLANDFYCDARLLEEKGYSIIAVKSKVNEQTTIYLNPADRYRKKSD